MTKEKARPPMAPGGAWMQHGGLPPVYVVTPEHQSRLLAEGAQLIDDPRPIESEDEDEDEQDESDEEAPADVPNETPADSRRPARSTSRKRLTNVRQPSDDIPALRGVPDVTVRQTGKHDEEEDV